MSRKTALVTGASVGIGKATAQALASLGYQLVLLARREQNLRTLAESIDTPTNIIACDINDHSAVSAALEDLPAEFKDIDLLVNNAGLALGLGTADQALWDDWQTMIQTNCVSLTYLTRQLLPAMVERNRGHIINLGSIAGTYPYQGGNVYGATKAFVDQFSINLRTDLLGTKIRVTNIQPGMLGDTEFSLVRFHGNKAAADAVYEGYQPLSPQDVAESICWVASQPEHVNINRLELMPTCQAPGGLKVVESENG